MLNTPLKWGNLNWIPFNLDENEIILRFKLGAAKEEPWTLEKCMAPNYVV